MDVHGRCHPSHDGHQKPIASHKEITPNCDVTFHSQPASFSSLPRTSSFLAPERVSKTERTATPLRRRQQGGFALLITITLLAFLVLLLVSLASLTRVETQVASNSQQLAQARQNALMALNIALGQLQQAAGPDQRATASASIGEAKVTDPDPSKGIGFTRTDASTTGLRVPNNGTRFWTGVWGNMNNVGDPTDPKNIYNANPAPVILNWLVSGNTAATSVTLNSDGSISAPLTEAAAKIPYLPDISITGLTDSTKATDALYIGGDTTKPVALLVGSNTVNANGSSTSGAAAKYVVAPLVPIQVASATIPGLAAGSTASIGRYAYWVGDEGVKAKYSLTDINKAKTDPLSSDEAGFRFNAAQRNGIELLTNMASYPVNDATILTKVIDKSQISLIDSSVTSAKLSQYYHDITVHSKGLLVDSLRGGLREDLTNRLSAGSSKPLTGAILPPTLAIVDSTLSNIVPKPINLPGINWDILADFYQNPLDSSTASVMMRAPTTTKAGITPVITKVRIGISFTVTKVGAVSTLNWIFYPVVYLGNPYDTDLEVPSAGLDIRFASTSNNGVGLSFVHNVTTTNVIFLNNNINNPLSANKTTALGGAILRIPGGTKIPAGAVKVFSLASDPNPYAPPQVINMKMDTVINNPTFGLLRPTGITLDSTYNSTSVAGVTGNGNVAVYLLPADSASISTPIKNDSDNNKVIQQIPSHYPYAWKFSSVKFNFNDATKTIFDYGYLYLTLRSPFSGSIYGNGPGVAIFASGNLRSSNMGDSIITASGVGSPYNKEMYNDGGVLSAAADRYVGYSYTKNIYANWGDLPNSINSMNVYTFPRRFSSTINPVISLAQLQHVNLSSSETSTSVSFPIGSFPSYTPKTILNTPYQPGNAIGNSFANPVINRHLSSTFWTAGLKSGSFYDISYLLNTSLFDSYFFSSLPQSTSAVLGVLPNNRLKLSSDAPASIAGFLTPTSNAAAKPDLSSATAPAKFLSVDGAFNINSTSVEAWATVLSGLKGLVVSTNSNQDGVDITPYPRSLRQTGKQAPPSTKSALVGPTADTYTGFRALTDKDIYDPLTTSGLAYRMVQQVKRRGPFVSLSQFVNRTLIKPPSPATSSETAQTSLGLKGALQAAIDDAGLNTAGFANDPSFKLTGTYYPTQNKGTYTETPNTSNTDNFVDVNAILGSRSMGAPGWLTQADILQAIGPSIASRSDTFVIRCYGDVMSPLDNSVPPSARAWCEAVVQRIPDYVDTTVDATTRLKNIPSSSAAATFGRKFKIVSFRWLSANDI